MKNLTLAIMLLTSLILASCGGGGGGTPVDRVQEFVDLLNDESNDYFWIEKRDTLTEGFVVVWSVDYGYMAYDVKNYLVGDDWLDYADYAEYQEVYIHDYEWDTGLGETVYYGDAYFNNPGGSFAGEFMFEQTANGSKDLLAAAAVSEKGAVAAKAAVLQNQYELSAPKAMQMAGLINAWNKFDNKSMQDADQFAKAITGDENATVQGVEQAYIKNVQGDSAEYDSLVSKAAGQYGMTAEKAHKVLAKVFVGTDE
ncbi:MAG: hypothetical protein ISR65_05580 [Bacteriovoracaceae bacterium]|nr:hypothetical protein [Bacteriovoracaceae bacterium]